MPTYTIINLSDAQDKSITGGKATTLGSLLRAGYNVPGGFVVSASIPDEQLLQIEDAIISAFDQLGANFVAVRSSAINEDGKTATWAGQLETYLNCDRDNLIRSIQKCRSSSQSRRAQSYGDQMGIHQTKVAVLVQKMIDSEISGVAFSAHPVTGSTDQVVIEAGIGLGEAIVSGTVTPDNYIYDKKLRVTTEKYISKQSKILIREKNGSTLWKPLGLEGRNQKLTDEQIKQIAAEAQKLERFFGYAVDIEWAINHNKIYILQCRPITTGVKD